MENGAADKNQGGMLGSSDFLRRVILDQVEKAKKVFWRREWDGDDSKDLKGKFIIEPFHPHNLTPFSYDLSIGAEVYSCRYEKVTHLDDRNPTYCLKPGETVVVKTEEFLALPPEYSAAVWPRFSMVTEAIFQSMVKIDPTWYGELGVALTNLSAAEYPIRRGDRFATLIIYELTTPSQMFLYRKEDCPETKEIPFGDGSIPERLKGAELGDLCRTTATGMHLLRLPSSRELRKLLDLGASNDWREAVLQGIARLPKPMDALGLTTLELVRPKPPKGKRLTPVEIGRTVCTPDDLTEAAVAYGSPFELLSGIPDLVLDKIEHEVTPRIRAEVESALFPKTVTLTLTVLGFLSLIVAVAAFLLDKYRAGSPFQGIDWPGTVTVLIIVLSVVLIAALYWLLFRPVPDSRALARMRRDIEELKKTAAKR
jgi:deoxycytidine triphosphate deaminase